MTSRESQVKLWPVYRLSSDTYRAFLNGMYPTAPFRSSRGHTYRALRAVDDQGYHLIPVPSRLYKQASGGDPAVEGTRIAIKGE